MTFSVGFVPVVSDLRRGDFVGIIAVSFALGLSVVVGHMQGTHLL